MEVYRIGENGARTLVSFKIKNGEIVISVKEVGRFAIVERQDAPIAYAESGAIADAKTPLAGTSAAGGAFPYYWLLIPIAALAFAAAAVFVRVRGKSEKPEVTI
jgi:hypothetical protein